MYRQLADGKGDFDKKEEELKRHKMEIENLKEKLFEAGKTIESNKEVISYLNKELNDNAPYRNFSNISKQSGIPKYTPGVTSKTNFGQTNNTVSVQDLPSNNFNQNSQNSEGVFSGKYGNKSVSNSHGLTSGQNQKLQNSVGSVIIIVKI